jgi:hypothetical protein
MALQGRLVGIGEEADGLRQPDAASATVKPVHLSIVSSLKIQTNAEVEVVFGRRVRPTDFIAVVRRDSRCSKKDCRLGATSWCCINA